VYHLASGPLSAQAVLERHQQRTLVVCNTVDRARALYRALQAHPALGETRVILLHSRFLPQDRQRHETDVRSFFGPSGPGPARVIGIATQVIEVGLDITCQTLHTELAPANALLQRAGRCARFPGQAGETIEGHVIVYPVDHYQPYKDDGLQQECERTWAALEALDGAVLDFSAEQALIDQVHTERDQSILESIRLRRLDHRRDIDRVLDGERGGARLVRSVSTRTVIVHSEPDELLESPWAVPGFGLHPGSLYGLFKRWQERGQALGLAWAVKRLEEDETQEGGATHYRWGEVTDAGDLRGARLVVVNNQLAGYRPAEGFLSDESTGFQCEPPGLAAHERSARSIVYQLESYADHVGQVCQALAQVALPELESLAQALEEREGWPHGIVVDAAWAVAGLHDTGKLTAGWQAWAREWQERLGQPLPAGQAAAHTDYDASNPRHRQLEGELSHKRPNHALEGAVAAARMLTALLSDCPPVLRAAFTAIARHHAPFTCTYAPFQIDATAAAQLDAGRACLPASLAARLDPAGLIEAAAPGHMSVDDFLTHPGQAAEFVCYTLLIRLLRRADQIGTRRGIQS
jgi:CRISPR-associated endonuclease/helicase Cas3